MAQTYIGQNTKIIAAEFDITSKIRSFSNPCARPSLDDEKLGDTAANVTPGLRTMGFSCEGPRDFGSGSIEETLNTLDGYEAFPIVVGYDGLTEGDEACVVQANRSEVGQNQVNAGELDVYSAAFVGAGGKSFFGRSMHALTEESAGGNSTGLELGAAAETDRLFCAVNCTAIGTDLDITIESDPANTFLSTTTQVTMTQLTAVGWEIKMIDPAAAISDTWWRVAWTLTGNATFTVIFGIIPYEVA